MYRDLDVGCYSCFLNGEGREIWIWVANAMCEEKETDKN